MTFSICATITVLFIAGVSSQGVGPYGCLTQASISSLTACDELSATVSSCFSVSTATASIESCFCKQAVLNKIVDCESDFRLCYLNDQFDYYGSSMLSNWHAWCSGYITFTPTTPVLSNPYTTVPTALPGDQNPFCTDYTTSCAIWSASEASCLDLDPSATASSFLECACSTDLLSLASVCVYDVAVSCFGKSTALSDVPLFSICGTTYSNDQLITALASAGNMISTSTSAAARQTPASQASRTVTSPSRGSTQSAQSGSAIASGTATQTTTSSSQFSGAANNALSTYAWPPWTKVILFVVGYLVPHLW